jgi:hypothetical protein
MVNEWMIFSGMVPFRIGIYINYNPPGLDEKTDEQAGRVS